MFKSTEFEITRLDPNELHADNLLEYTNFRLSTCRTYKDRNGMGEYINKWNRDIQSRSIARVRAYATLGNPEDALELGLRLFTGCSTPKDEESAIAWWTFVAENKAVIRRVRARACSCLSRVHFDRRIVKNETWNIDSVYRACLFADQSAAMGFVSPQVLATGFMTEEIGFRRPEDLKFPRLSTERFEKLENLWDACDTRKAEMQEKAEARGKKLSKAPHAYVCAAEGCGIQATKKSALSACYGGCPVEAKPHYCSKECQRKDWPRHKPICKGEVSASTAVTVAPKSMELQEYRPSEAESDSSTVDENLRIDGQEYAIELPPRPDGKFGRITSKTMTPSFMKEFRAEIQRIGLDNGHR